MKVVIENGTLSKIISDLFDRNEWQKARRLIVRELAKDPQNHWLLTRLSTTYYEEYKYEEALDASLKAMEIKPHCPLVLWDLATTLDMISREEESIHILKKLLRRGVLKIAYDECGEGRRWSESLLNDCRFRIANSYRRLNQMELSKKFILLHLRHRKPGLPSLYSITEAKELLRSVS